MFSISKDQSIVIKGIAILMMLFLHLFNKEEFVSMYTPSFYVNGMPFEYCLSRAMNPVGIFVFISGYGLYKSWLNTQYGMKNAIKRLPRLFIVYWLIMAIFVTIGIFINPGKYPGSLLDLFYNITALRTTYNGEGWFLLPYVSLSVASAYIFPLVNRWKWYILSVLMLSIFYFEAILYGRFWNFIFDNTLLLYFCRTIEISCVFVLGAIVAKHSGYIHPFFKIQEKLKRLVAGIAVIAMIAYSSLFGIPLAPVYFVVFTILMANILSPDCSSKKIYKPLLLLGKYSMPIWLIHTYYCRYLFQGFIYSFEYPLLIYLVELLLSTLSAIIIMKVVTPIISLASK